jgi:hypothetical protein
MTETEPAARQRDPARRRPGFRAVLRRQSPPLIQVAGPFETGLRTVLEQVGASDPRASLLRFIHASHVPMDQV